MVCLIIPTITMDIIDNKLSGGFYEVVNERSLRGADDDRPGRPLRRGPGAAQGGCETGGDFREISVESRQSPQGDGAAGGDPRRPRRLCSGKGACRDYHERNHRGFGRTSLSRGLCRETGHLQPRVVLYRPRSLERGSGGHVADFRKIHPRRYGNASEGQTG